MMEFLLFSHEPAYAASAVAAGAAGVIVDWEWHGKHARQVGCDTEINQGSLSELRAIAAVAPGRVLCRVNNTPGCRDGEADLAIDHGASEILLPMVRTAAEVESMLRHLDGRARLGILVETRAAMSLGPLIDHLPLSRVYIGLHDYRIDSGGAGLFDPLVDGTIDRFRDSYQGPLGVAGLTRVDAGAPVPQRLLLAAMARLRCAFGVARRAFRADVAPQRIGPVLQQVRAEWERLRTRGAAAQAADHHALAQWLAAVETPGIRGADDSQAPGLDADARACGH